MRTRNLLAVIAVMLVVGPVVAFAQSEPADPPAVEQAADYEGGTWFEWQKMTGNWGGVRNKWADEGFTLELDFNQVLQGNFHGGVDTSGLHYDATADLNLTFDTAKLGLWPGGSLLLHGELKTGDGIQPNVGSWSPVNLDIAKPGYEDCDFTLSEVIYTQVLMDGGLVLIGGKLDGSRAFDRNEFANNEHTQFMNASLRNNPMIPAFLPYTNWGVGIIVNPTPWLSVMTAVADSEGSVKLDHFDTAFHGDTNTTVIHEWSFNAHPYQKKGTYRAGIVWSCMDAPELMPPDMSEDNTMFYLNFDQYFYQEAEDEGQGVGLFGRFGWSDDDVNPIEYYYSTGIGGKGIIPTRDKDTFGIGYYHLEVSDNMPPMFVSEQGIECFYNFEVTPWLHITPDIQAVIDPGGIDGRDVAIVGGLRLHMNL